MLVAAGPSGIRLQEVAADVGVSHPTVLHHFGSREGLVEAVVARALDSLHQGILAAVQTSTPKGPAQAAALLERVHESLMSAGHARAFLWLALAGYDPTMEQFRVREVAEAVHERRRTLWQEHSPSKRVPPFEDTYFTMLLPVLALLSLSVTCPADEGAKGSGDEPCSPRRFRAWLARLIHDHLDRGPLDRG
jgi:AcrR family transcriptional regulator